MGQFAQACGRVIDQPAVIDSVGKRATKVLAVALPAGILASHALKTTPEERPKVLLKDALVLTGIGAATLLATRRWMMTPDLKKGVLSFAERELQRVSHASEEALQKLVRGKLSHYPEKLQTLMLDRGLDEPGLQKLVNGMYRHAATPQKFVEDTRLLVQYKQNAHWDQLITDNHYPADLAALIRKEKKTPKDFQELLAKLGPEQFKKLALPDDAGETFWEAFKDDLGELKTFGAIGGFPVLGGLAGGLLADKITGAKGGAADKVKESVFQFISNIFFPVATGAFGISLLNVSAIKTHIVKDGLRKQLIRSGVVGASIAAGIATGMVVANKFGEKVLDPLFGTPPKDKTLTGTERKADLFDVSMHADDLPTVLVIAGVKIIGPFLPFLFGMSGWRAGTGFRSNKKHAKQAAVSIPVPSAPQTSLSRGPVFSHLSQQHRINVSPAPSQYGTLPTTTVAGNAFSLTTQRTNPAFTQ
jgi:hypothetical protein